MAVVPEAKVVDVAAVPESPALLLVSVVPRLPVLAKQAAVSRHAAMPRPKDAARRQRRLSQLAVSVAAPKASESASR